MSGPFRCREGQPPLRWRRLGLSALPRCHPGGPGTKSRPARLPRKNARTQSAAQRTASRGRDCARAGSLGPLARRSEIERCDKRRQSSPRFRSPCGPSSVRLARTTAFRARSRTIVMRCRRPAEQCEPASAARGESVGSGTELIWERFARAQLPSSCDSKRSLGQ